MNPLLNRYEKITHEHLTPICERNGAEVYPKVRLKDVLPIDGSGVDSRDFRFSLQSHFDFTVADAATKPLFAVEFDGPSHKDPEQIARDTRKNALCERFGLSLLRVNSRYMDMKFREMDLLTYFVEVWFMNAAFEEAFHRGDLPLDADFDPWLVMSDPNSKKTFPYWLSAEAQIALQRLYERGKIAQSIPSDYIGKSPSGAYHCLAWIPVDKERYGMITTGMRSQQFPVVVADLVSQIGICDLHRHVLAILNGKERAISKVTLLAKIREFEQKYEMRMRSGTAGFGVPDA